MGDPFTFIVSGLGDVAEEARLRAQEAGCQGITFEDVDRAINEQLMPSDAAFKKAVSSPARSGRRQFRNTISESLPAQCSPAAEHVASAADRPEEALAPEDLPERDTCPANLDERNLVARTVPGSHRQTSPALVPA